MLEEGLQQSPWIGTWAVTVLRHLTAAAVAVVCIEILHLGHIYSPEPFVVWKSIAHVWLVFA